MEWDWWKEEDGGMGLVEGGGWVEWDWWKEEDGGMGLVEGGGWWGVIGVKKGWVGGIGGKKSRDIKKEK